jgi:hypothetical protein
MSAKPTRRGRTLGVLVAVCLAVLLSSVPGVAAANSGTVRPVVDCYRLNSNYTVTIVVGYVNPNNGTKNIPLGTRNTITPAKFHGVQPTSFKAGTQRGAFSVVLTQADLNSTSSWTLDGNTLNYATVGNMQECSPSTPLPAIGNGTVLAVALLAGGGFGVWFVRRQIRRAPAAG